jgi:hypothetical protein
MALRLAPSAAHAFHALEWNQMEGIALAGEQPETLAFGLGMLWFYDGDSSFGVSLDDVFP